ncbi:prolyl 4-hydroxylase, beta polypeptide [Monoraphidium neglectum]|uniref:Prolyl 4-hydroxylase, beta polypeptide n=1 Tax=Monoraphidium neglectum TaxID=145388 RepID=A0A0D2MS26_9CHLO|nr:prolyl 4-hydroxylase, beta polypeptide [Monoraphidium neglectum]KIZ05380.1 prolyl 4-hydroxylase, beta polypeptide [Monoraphidium neglectum]|eukprot:XP_013904399.1 prolyl 4-hydroxylase, beta polypeptide [Monoraphidium neglectum]
MTTTAGKVAHPVQQPVVAGSRPARPVIAARKRAAGGASRLGAPAELRGKAVFVTVDLEGSAKEPVVNFFGIKEGDAPVVVGFDMGGNKKYKFADDISAKHLKKFTQDLLDGKLTPEFKSAAIPDEPLDGGVTVVVGKNFDAIVKDESKDVLLEVYAPWCGHCKSLEPIYKKLAKRFSKVWSRGGWAAR